MQKSPSNIMYIHSEITRNVPISINYIGENIVAVLESFIRHNYDGKCTKEGLIKADSTKIINYSMGQLNSRGQVEFTVVVECDIFNPAAGIIMSGIVTNNNKAGLTIRASDSSDTNPSPFMAYVVRDHINASTVLDGYREGDKVTFKVIGSQFGLGDDQIHIIVDLITGPQ